jgi:hypothetical protein
LTPTPVVLVVDVANVMGSRPDGWWRDRAGAATRLLASLVPLTAAKTQTPDGAPIELQRIIAVVEGQAKTAIAPAEVDVRLAPADGDSTIVLVSAEVLAQHEIPLVVTADRGLRARLSADTLIAGPRWLTDQL